MRIHTAVGRNSILGSYVKAVGRALDAAGCDGAALLAEAGFDLKDLDGADARCPLVNTGHLWRIAVAATGDPAFGIKVANHYKHTTFHALGYGTSASSTLKEAFERVQRYCHVVSDAVDYRFFRRGTEYHFIIEPAVEISPPRDRCVGKHLPADVPILDRKSLFAAVDRAAAAATGGYR